MSAVDTRSTMEAVTLGYLVAAGLNNKVRPNTGCVNGVKRDLLPEAPINCIACPRVVASAATSQPQHQHFRCLIQRRLPRCTHMYTLMHTHTYAKNAHPCTQADIAYVDNIKEVMKNTQVGPFTKS